MTIRPKDPQEITSLRKNIWKYYGGNVFFREGSMSMPKVFDIELTDSNSEIVASIEAHSQNNIQYTLDGCLILWQNERIMSQHIKCLKSILLCVGLVKRKL